MANPLARRGDLARTRALRGHSLRRGVDHSGNSPDGRGCARHLRPPNAIAPHLCGAGTQFPPNLQRSARMRQALHIFQKDVRYLRLEVGLLVLLAAALTWVKVHVHNDEWSE